MRYSRQREALLKLLRSTTTHPDAEWLYCKLKEEYPNISLGTVYRNLRALSESGEIIELDGESGSRFDGDISEHYHMKCKQCGCVVDVPKSYVSLELNSACDMKIDGFTLMFSGLCSECSKI